MATETYLVITDGTTVITFADGSGGATSYNVADDAWAPQITGLRRSRFGGRGPFTEVVESLEIHITGATVPDCLANKETLANLLEQAERWSRGEAVAPVVIKYSPKGATTSSVAAPLQAVILGRASDDTVGAIGLPVSFEFFAGTQAYIVRAQLSFVRRGLWLHVTDAVTTAAVSSTFPGHGEFSSSLPVMSPVQITIDNLTPGAALAIPASYLLIARNKAVTSAVASESISPSPSASPSSSVSPSVSPSPTASPSASVSPSASISRSPSASISPSASASRSASRSISPSASASPSVSPSVSPSASPSAAAGQEDAYLQAYAASGMTATGYTAFNDAANLPRNEVNVLRYTPTGTAFVVSGSLTLTAPISQCRRVAVYATIRKSIAARTFQVYGEFVSNTTTRAIQTGTLTIGSDVTALTPLCYHIGTVSLPVDHLNLPNVSYPTFKLYCNVDSITGTPLLDFDALIFLGLDDEAGHAVGIEAFTIPNLSSQSIIVDHNSLTRPDPSVILNIPASTQTESLGYVGDPWCNTVLDRITLCWVATRGAFWRYTVNAGTVGSQTFTALRHRGYLTPV